MKSAASSRRRKQLCECGPRSIRPKRASGLTKKRTPLAQGCVRFPKKLTTLRKGMPVHCCFHHPCPVCGTLVQRIVYAENETNYCPRCQTGGKVLADRSLSRLLNVDSHPTLQ